MEFNKVLDNKNHQAFETGSVRDSAEGKGMPHLIAGEVMADVIEYSGRFGDIEKILYTYCAHTEDDPYFIGNILMACKLVLRELIIEENNSYANAMRRFAQHYENGATKYSKNNWRKGQPISRYYDSALRHLWQMKDKNIEEDHFSALLWNLTCILQTKKDIQRGDLPKELNDFPFNKKQLFNK